MQRPVVVVTNRAFPDTLDLLSERCTVRSHHADEPPPRDEVLRRTADADAIVAFMPDRIDDAFLAACPRLRIVSCALKGYDNFDVDACTRRGVWVSIVPDLLTEPTAELAIGLAIGLGRHVLAADRVVREGRFAGWRPTFYGRSLDGAKVAILGAGRVGRAIARKLAGFQCTVRLVDPVPTPDLPPNARMATPEDALPVADFVFVATPLAEATTHLVDEAWLERLKPGALLVNPARGSVVDESAVAAALASGRLGGYAADVFECEDWARADRPASIHPALVEDPARTLFTTHIGSAVTEVRRAIERDAALNVLEALAGERPHGAINEVRAA